MVKKLSRVDIWNATQQAKYGYDPIKGKRLSKAEVYIRKKEAKHGRSFFS